METASTEPLTFEPKYELGGRGLLILVALAVVPVVVGVPFAIILENFVCLGIAVVVAIVVMAFLLASIFPRGSCALTLDDDGMHFSKGDRVKRLGWDLIKAVWMDKAGGSVSVRLALPKNTLTVGDMFRFFGVFTFERSRELILDDQDWEVEDLSVIYAHARKRVERTRSLDDF